jgi:hypothetical protein
VRPGAANKPSIAANVRPEAANKPSIAANVTAS